MLVNKIYATPQRATTTKMWKEARIPECIHLAPRLVGRSIAYKYISVSVYQCALCVIPNHAQKRNNGKKQSGPVEKRRSDDQKHNTYSEKCRVEIDVVTGSLTPSGVDEIVAIPAPIIQSKTKYIQKKERKKQKKNNKQHELPMAVELSEQNNSLTDSYFRRVWWRHSIK